MRQMDKGFCVSPSLPEREVISLSLILGWNESCKLRKDTFPNKFKIDWWFHIGSILCPVNLGEKEEEREKERKKERQRVSE